MPSASTGFTLTRIADTTDRFREFGPYVAALNNAGTVAFQASLSRGGSGVFTGDGGPVTTIFDTNGTPIRAVLSHPDINAGGSVSFYGEREAGERGVFLVRGGELIRLGGAGPTAVGQIGPLGPTMNDGDAVAFRADLPEGASGIFVGAPDATRAIAHTGDRYGAFWGLPVITDDGTVVFRADLREGGQGIYAHRGDSLTTIADTTGAFQTLGFFPSANDDGEVAFAATRKQGGGGIFHWIDGDFTTVIETSDGFDSLRGAWINNAGAVFFLGTPSGGTLGIHSGANPHTDRILGLGDALFGSTITDFAANPVSLNDAGQLAIRVALATGREVILRADPVG